MEIYSFVAPDHRMKIIPNKIYFLWLWFALISLAACRDDNTVKRQPMAGNWVVHQAICDDVEQPSWIGKTISFKQVSADSGTYEFPNSPYDSIWNKSGNWKVVLSDAFLRYDSDPPTPADFLVTGDTLKIRILIIQHHPTDEHIGSSFLPDISGNWLFTFQRN